MNHLDDDYLPTRLAAAEKGWEEALVRERRLEGIIAGILIQSGGRLTVTEESIETGQRQGFTVRDSSTLGEKAIRLDLGRTS